MRIPHPTTQALLLLIALLFMLSAPVSAEQHELTFDRKRPVGSTFKIILQGEQTNRQAQTVDGKQAGRESNTIKGKLEGVAEVLEVHENKKTKSAAIKLSLFEGSRNNVAFELDLTKRVIATAEGGGMTLAYEDGAELSEKAAELLDVLLGFMIEEAPSDIAEDEMFKLRQPREAGSSWACDSELIAKDMSHSGALKIDPDKVDGTFKFIEVGELNGQKAAKIDINIKLNAIGIPAMADQGIKMISSGGELSMAGHLPLDPKSFDGTSTMRMSMSFVAGLNANGSEIRITNEVKASVQATYLQIK
ncbi:MAG: hypothetical protein AAGI37_00165 [Planctomycetota bacterium]